MAVTFHADASSFQGTVNWRAVREAGYGGGAEKCTEGTGYVNPYWPAARAALLAVAGPEFVPGAYLFLHAGNGAGQADYFAGHAGDIPGFVIWADLERGTTTPSVGDAREAVAQLRRHYPGHRIGLYAGESYTGAADLRFADLLWSPHYISGSGSPAGLYAHVPASYWAPYGGHTPVLLQFSQSAQVPGVAGLADVSAFRGAPAQMHAALLGEPAPAPAPKPKPVPAPAEDDDMIMIQPPEAAYPKGQWPGVWLLLSSGKLHHVGPVQDGVSNTAAYAQAGVKGPVTITAAEFTALRAGS